MIEISIIKDDTGTIDLIEHRSTDGMKLRNNETGKVYGSYVVDAISGYKDGEPYTTNTYTETDEPDESDYKTALQISLGERDGDLQ